MMVYGRYVFYLCNMSFIIQLKYDICYCVQVNNDDGSSYYLIHNNFEVYANGGLKNNFGGHNVRHYNNIFGYVQSFCLAASAASGKNEQYPGYIDQYSGNDCTINDPQVDGN